MTDVCEEISLNLKKIRKLRPLILNITNDVAMDFSANALLAIGASPIMCQAAEEVEELVRYSSAVVINMGTLHKEWVSLAELAWSYALRLEKPLVFDPVGIGATNFRQETGKKLLSLGKPSVIRGNLSEILSLKGKSANQSGVDSHDAMDESVHEFALSLRNEDLIYVMSGATDLISGQNHYYSVANGSAHMQDVTATGCVSSALIAAFLGTGIVPHISATQAMTTWGLCGELASETYTGPASLRTQMIDLLSQSEKLPFFTRMRVSQRV